MRAPGWLTAQPVAHRGYHDAAAGRLENTLTAAEAAIARGFAIECDLQVTADDRVVVFHDDTLDRLTSLSGRVDRKSLAEIRSAKLKGTDDRIPTLAEFLDAVDGRVPVVVEFKSSWTGDRRLEALAATDLARYRGPAAVMSFDPASVRALRDLLPGLPRGITADRYATKEWPELSAAYRFALRHLCLVPPLGASFVAYDVHGLPSAAPLLFRRLGVALLTWTVRTPADRATARRYADQMIFEHFDPAIAA